MSKRLNWGKINSRNRQSERLRELKKPGYSGRNCFALFTERMHNSPAHDETENDRHVRNKLKEAKLKNPIRLAHVSILDKHDE